MDGSVMHELLLASTRLLSLARGMTMAYRVSKDQRALRAELMLEELAEVLQALADRDEVELADGIADLLYVTFGTGNQFDIPTLAVFEEVHRSNMTKHAGAADHAGDKGKGDGFSPADIQSTLNAYHGENKLP